jgi:hypothetical protein
MFTISNDNCINISILTIIVLLVLFLYRNYIAEENFATDLEAVANVASLYNTGNFQVNNMNVTQDAKVGGTASISGNAVISGNASVAQNLNANVISASNGITTNSSLITNTNSNEGGNISIRNGNKTGSKISNWTIFNMTGGYGDSLKFWRYGADGSNPGPVVSFGDDGNVEMTNNLSIGGALKVGQIDYTEQSGGAVGLWNDWGGKKARCPNGYYVAGFDQNDHPDRLFYVICRKLPGA